MPRFGPRRPGGRVRGCPCFGPRCVAYCDERCACRPGSRRLPRFGCTGARCPHPLRAGPVAVPDQAGAGDRDAKLLIAADCTAYAYANFHREFMAGRVTLIGCPKLDNIDYSEKLTAIIANNPIASVEVLRMDVPCCSGLENATVKALQQSGKFIPWSVVTIGRDGTILDRRP